MKNWLAVALATVFVGGVILTTTDCGKSKHLPDSVEKTLSGQRVTAPKPNDTVHKASRLAIKRATDAAAGKISMTPTKTTIEAMLKVARPDGLAADGSSPEFQEKRAGSFEATLWQVDATITEIVKRADGDFYLVMESPSGARSVVEVPDPALCAGSKKLAEITKAREALEAKFHPSAQPQKVHLKARVTGFGFFGNAKAREGRPATNGARIMPGLKIDWL